MPRDSRRTVWPSDARPVVATVVRLMLNWTLKVFAFETTAQFSKPITYLAKDGWVGSEGFAIHTGSKVGEDGAMAILIVLHNHELATEIGTILRGTGRATKVCPSVTGPEFLKEFSGAELIVTDLSPPVLSFLTVGGENLLRGSKPIVVIASRGHCASFSAMLPAGRGRCVALEPSPEFFQLVRDAVEALLGQACGQSPGTRADSFQPPSLPAKRVTADSPHEHRADRFTRKAIDRQVQFVSDIAHDLRTPLTAIGEFAHLMRTGNTGEMNDQQRRYVGIIERRCDEATRMVYDLLDGAKLQSGRMHPHRQAVELRDVLADVRESLAPAFRQSGVELVSEMPDGLPCVFADRDMLGRIVANLVSNAVKFSPPQATVTIRAERQSVSTGRISVIDSGAGISSEDLRRIFRRFERGSNHTPNGVGLGLAIVRELVRLHGGRVSVESTLGKGSQFHFTIPLHLPAAIIRRFFAQLGDLRCRIVTSWEFDCPESAKYDAIHRLITSTVRSRDLVLPDDGRRCILLVTHSKNPERLLDDLRHQIAIRGGTVPSITRLETAEAKMWHRRSSAQPRPRRESGDSAQMAG
jgi:signal transduction histidine kinase